MKNKTLYFEGAGLENAYKGEISNCRIRTAFTNNEGKKIYLEILGTEKTLDDVKKYRRYENYIIGEAIGFIDSCHYITDDPRIDDENENRLKYENNENIHYSYDGILKFVNENCNCSFDNIEVLGWLSGYRVFSDNGKYGTYVKYNYGDEFQYNKELETKRVNKKKELEDHFCKIFNQKYSNASIWCNGNENILHVQINVSDDERKSAGYNERCFEVQL